MILGAPGLKADERATLVNSSEDTMKKPKVIRFKENPIIRTEMIPGPDGENMCGPSLIRVPDWLPNPLGKYYLYFAHHKGAYIRLAYADRLEGPWTIYEPGSLRLEEILIAPRGKKGKEKGDGSAAPDKEIKSPHIASPDVHVDDEKKEIRMYFHGLKEGWPHTSKVAVSRDGIHFQPVDGTVGSQPYFRVFQWDGYYYAVTRTGSLVRSRDGLTEFQNGNRVFGQAIQDKAAGTGIRHSAVKLDGDVLSVFFTRTGDTPESVLLSTAELKGDWTTWKLSPPVKILEPEMDYEGANLPLTTSKEGQMKGGGMKGGHERALRDPCIYREGDKTYLLYSIRGEAGIAIGELRN